MGVARGNAVMTKTNGQSLAADLIGAHFEKRSIARGHRRWKTGSGHAVVITTANTSSGGDEENSAIWSPAAPSAR